MEEDSACLFGRPKQILDAPHSMMNKFFGPSDANFLLVGNTIKFMVDEAKIIADSQREGIVDLYQQSASACGRPTLTLT